MDTAMVTNQIMAEVGADFQADEPTEAGVLDFRPEAQVVEQEQLQVSEALEEDEQKKYQANLTTFISFCDVLSGNTVPFRPKNQK